MSRIRSIHPGLATDDEYMGLSHVAGRVLPLLWCECDDQGLFEWKPRTLKARLLPAHNDDMEAVLAELVKHNFLRKVEIDGRQLGAIRNFRKFQRPKSPNAIHPTNADIRNYVGLSQPISEIKLVEPPPVHPNGEKSPQMEDGGGRRKESTPVAEATDGEPSLEKQVFRQGKKVLGVKAGGLIKRLVMAFDFDYAALLVMFEEAAAKENPAEWVGAVLKRHEGDAKTDELGLTVVPYTAAMIDEEYRRLGVQS